MDNVVTSNPMADAAVFRIAKKSFKSRRRFPGPAGLLPALTPTEFAQIDSPKRTRNPISEEIDKIICAATYSVPLLTSSQLQHSQEGSLFEDSPWSTLLAQLELKADLSSDSVMSLMNINWIVTKAIKLPMCNKIPFLAAVLQEKNNEVGDKIERFTADGNSNVTLVDPTGTIEASVDPDFHAAYADELNSGTALALKNVGILQFKRAVILTVTESNVICMTSRSESEDCQKPKPNKQRRTLKSFVTENDVRVSHFCDFNPDQMIKNFHVTNLGVADRELDDEDDEDDENQEIENRLSSYQPNLFSSTSANSTGFKNIQFSTMSNDKHRTKFLFQQKSNPMSSFDKYYPSKTTVVPRPPKQQQQHVSSATPTLDGDTTFEDDDDDEFFRAIDESVLTHGESVAKNSFLVTPNSVTGTVEIGHEIANANLFTEGRMSTEDDDDKFIPHHTSVRADGGGEIPFESDDDEIFTQCDENYSQATKSSSNQLPAEVKLPSFPEHLVSHSTSLDQNSKKRASVPREAHDVCDEEEMAFDDDDDEFFKVLQGIHKE